MKCVNLALAFLALGASAEVLKIVSRIGTWYLPPAMSYLVWGLWADTLASILYTKVGQKASPLEINCSGASREFFWCLFWGAVHEDMLNHAFHIYLGVISGYSFPT